jgi:hypothetical protein
MQISRLAHSLNYEHWYESEYTCKRALKFYDKIIKPMWHKYITYKDHKEKERSKSRSSSSSNSGSSSSSSSDSPKKKKKDNGPKFPFMKFFNLQDTVAKMNVNDIRAYHQIIENLFITVRRLKHLEEMDPCNKDRETKYCNKNVHCSKKED